MKSDYTRTRIIRHRRCRCYSLVLRRYVAAVGDSYGLALLFHMLITTFTLTLLAYQATQVTKV